MKITKDTKVERIITLELTESELNTVIFALGDICYGTLEELKDEYDKSILSQDALYEMFCTLHDKYILDKK